MAVVSAPARTYFAQREITRYKWEKTGQGTDIHHDVADNLIVTHNVRVCLLGLEEVIQEVTVLLLLRQSLALHDPLETVEGGMLERGELDGTPRVLAQPSVEPWHLSNLFWFWTSVNYFPTLSRVT